jgi:hypothetical protein
MLAICLSASQLDARSVCKMPSSTSTASANAPMPPLANEPTRRDGPDLHNPRLVCKGILSTACKHEHRLSAVDAFVDRPAAGTPLRSSNISAWDIVFCCVARCTYAAFKRVELALDEQTSVTQGRGDRRGPAHQRLAENILSTSFSG